MFNEASDAAPVRMNDLLSIFPSLLETIIVFIGLKRNYIVFIVYISISYIEITP